MSKILFIHAINVHQGGGRSLLESLLTSLDENTEFFLLLDERMSIPLNLVNDIRIKRVKPSIFQRILAERWLACKVSREDIVLCFGNQPPLFKLRGHTVVFLQNRYLIDDVPLSVFKLKVRLRLAVERFWLTSKMLNASEFIVQTSTMQRLLEIKLRGRLPVRAIPFISEPDRYARRFPECKVKLKTNYDFVYVASGEPHKNHRRLIEGWCLLAEEGIFPLLCLTLDVTRFYGLCDEIELMREQYGLKLMNVGELPHQDIVALYKKAAALIYPSTFESFGLPLIEARQCGLSVLASELDYVRDVLDPEQTFDPESAVSIARAVKRFMGIEESALPLLDATGFLKVILEESR